MDVPTPHKRKRSTSPPSINLSLLEALEKSQTNPIETLGLKTLKKLSLSLERRLNANTAAYLKHPDKFADSKLDLYDKLHKLKILVGAPKLYPDLGTVNSITSLLNHDNTNIAIDVVTLLQDLTDADFIEDNEDSTRVLVDSLIENNAVKLLVQNLARLNDADPDETTVIYNMLLTIENLIKNSVANQRRFGQMNDVDTLLQAMAMYKSRDLKTGDKEVLVENLFDCLCCLLTPLENKERFLKAEGVQLMIIIMNQKKSCYGSTIRSLDYLGV